MKLSIIVPMYNAEEFLEQCLGTIMAFKGDQLEVIVVNDGSSDHSTDICESFCRKDSRFKLINQKNRGVSVARNTGIDAATGKYIMFLDADDYLKTEKWVMINEMIEKEKYEFIAFSYTTLFENGKQQEERFHMQEQETENIYTARKLMLATSDFNACWGKLFLREKVVREQIKFKEGIKIGEDAIFVAEYLEKCSSVLVKNESILYYRQHANSVMHRVDIYKRLEYFKLLYNLRIQMASEIGDENLQMDMYSYHFSIITNLLLDAANERGLFQLWHTYREIVNTLLVKKILSVVKQSLLSPVYKRLEYSLIEKEYYFLMCVYFKSKSIVQRVQRL